MSDETAATVLLVLRLRSFASTELISSTVGLDSSVVAAELRRLATLGWIRHVDGPVTGWTLTPEGRRRGVSLIHAEVEADGSRRLVEVCYEEFLPLNIELLAVCTDWQTVELDGGERIVNDHADSVHDRSVLDRLDELHRSVIPLLERLSSAASRFDPYASRLTTAHGHVQQGVTEWIAKPTLDSYHTVWFELHEHLLVTLGLDRESERTPNSTPSSNGAPQ